MTGRNEALIAAMADRDINSGQLARAAGVGRSTVTNWRGGHRIPSPDNATRVAELLDVTVAELWPDLAAGDSAAGELAERLEQIDRVAAAAGVTRQTVRSWLTGRSKPGLLARAALAANGFTADCQPASRPSRCDTGSHIHLLTCWQVLALPAHRDPKWRERALCASNPDPDLWWPEDDEDPGTAARQVCLRCPVIAACRDAFLADPWPDRHCVIAGVWGASLLAEAQRQRRQQRRSAA